MFESWSVSQIVTHTANIFSKHGNSEDLDQSWQLFGSQTLLHFPLHHWGLKKKQTWRNYQNFPLGCFKTAFFPEEKTHTISGFLTARIQTHCTTLPRNVWYLGMRQKSSFFCWIWWEITYNNLAKHKLRLHGCSESPAQLIQHPYFLTEYDKLTEGNGLHVDDHLTVCIATVPHSHSRWSWNPWMRSEPIIL